MSYTLVVDDDPAILHILTQLLEGEGFPVVPCEDSQQALLQARIAPPALALVDILMPRMGGRELIQRLRAEVDPELPIIVMSASAHFDQVRDLTIQDFIAKPFDLDDVVERVARSTDGGAPAQAYANASDDPARSQPGFHQSNA